MPEVVKNPALRTFLFVLGVAAFVLGVIGAFLPVLPTTPFMILSAFCFVRSSPKAHACLYSQPLFGKALSDWDRHGVIARKPKVLAVTMMVVSAAVMWWKVDNVLLTSLVSVVLFIVAVFVITRKERV